MRRRSATGGAAKSRRRKTAGPKRRKPAQVARGRTPLVVELQKQVAALTRDLAEARDQQAATSQVLGVISSSPAELEPVFQAMLANATRLCAAKFGTLMLAEGDSFRVVAMHGAPRAYVEERRRQPMLSANSPTGLGRVVATRQPVQVADIQAEAAYARDPSPSALANLAGARTLLTVPMLKDNEVVGAIGIYRQEVRPFADKQIELVSNFAAQAVIAIANTRLLNELRQRTDDLTAALEQQTATSEVLQIISSSPGELQPVFQAMLKNATHICEARFGVLYRYDDVGFIPAALSNAPQEYENFVWSRGRFLPQAGNALDRLLHTKQVIHTADEAAAQVPTNSAKLAGARSQVLVPMIKEDKLAGAIAIYRQVVRPFTDKQIALLTNFAAQAVIAIENTRLLNELRQRTDDLTEALEQQTATSEVLQVISSSPGELAPVFQAILANAVQICEAKFGAMFRFEGEESYPVAALNSPPALDEWLRQRGRRKAPTGQTLDQIWRSKQAVHIIDDLASEVPSPPARFAGARTHLAVPMLKDEDLVGAIIIYRQEVRPFTDKQIALVQNFANQAVIAIENTRLLNELRQRTDDLTEALEQQTATSEVLSVISSSPGELEPVFQSLLTNATRLCEATFGVMWRLEDGVAVPVAELQAPPAFVQFLQSAPHQLNPGTPLARAVETHQPVHIPDIKANPAYRNGEPFVVHATDLSGARTLLIVPMMKDDDAIGAIAIYRNEVHEFTGKQIELVKNFAAQAVIAIENTRLLNELRQRTDDLSEALEQQTATSEVLKVISRSPGALEPVFNAMLENATRICEAEFGVLYRYRDGAFHVDTLLNVPPALAEELRRDPRQPTPASAIGRVAMTKQTVHIEDIRAERAYVEGDALRRATADLGGARTFVAVPMFREEQLLGAFVIYRQEVRAFTNKQIALLESFAAQAVIAIENTRLLSELRQSLEQQTATADVLKVISGSAFDLQPVLNTIVETAARLCSAEFAVIFRLQDDGKYHSAASNNAEDAFLRHAARHPIAAGRGSLIGRTALEKKTIHLPDCLADPEYAYLEYQNIGKYRSILGVPLIREGVPIGVIGLMRTAIMPFTDKQIELVTTFADQAVIAIENVRLFEEIQDKSRQLAEASQHKSQFLANMSHELRTPLNAILGYTELIVDGVYGEPTEKMLGVLKRLESNGRHLLGLINDVLDLSKIEAGQLVLDLADYSLKNVAHTVYSAVEPLAADKKLAFKIEVAPDLPPARGDERRLTQVLLNLVGNAIKFTDAGEVAIKATASDGSFNLSVRDTGPGISAADQAKLFQEFQQADNSITRKKGGTGLGLAISKRIIEMHGGKIWVESHVGQGSTFFVTLPVQVRERARPPSKD